ncbi:hypothetical protein [Geodermatophilus sp. URMC 64]
MAPPGTAPVRPPTAAARLAVETVARFLPTPADRRRYQAEFVAELYGLPVGRQLRYAAGVLARAHALRSTLGAAVRLPVVPGSADPPWRRFLCRHLHWHHWRTFATTDGRRYLACAVCAKEKPDPPHWLAGAAG